MAPISSAIAGEQTESSRTLDSNEFAVPQAVRQHSKLMSHSPRSLGKSTGSGSGAYRAPLLQAAPVPRPGLPRTLSSSSVVETIASGQSSRAQAGSGRAQDAPTFSHKSPLSVQTSTAAEPSLAVAAPAQASSATRAPAPSSTPGTSKRSLGDGEYFPSGAVTASQSRAHSPAPRGDRSTRASLLNSPAATSLAAAAAAAQLQKASSQRNPEAAAQSRARTSRSNTLQDLKRFSASIGDAAQAAAGAVAPMTAPAFGSEQRMSADQQRIAEARRASHSRGGSQGEASSPTTPTNRARTGPTQQPPPPRPLTEAEERARAAAKAAEQAAWERTRGAGSDVMKLRGGEADERRRARAQDDEDSDDGKAAVASDWRESDVLPSLEECERFRSEPVDVPSADVLLERGISDYTLLPRILGRGKFSTVFMASKNGERSAVKHTALFPHHQLISTRLLREPTLLAELPPHPNLVSVIETVRTPGHFYLVEEYLGGYVTLEALIPLVGGSGKTGAPQPSVLPVDVANRVLDQLISAVHAIHFPLQICHRDIKPENILVHPDTLQLKLLDFGLATHYSKSEPKLSTCCGSPAFHCPEIVKALASPPGAVSYWGPEVDAWTCGVTMLRCLTGVRFPLGANHTSLRSMSIRAQRAVATIADAPLRDRVSALLEMDGARRMQRFAALAADLEREQGEPDRNQKAFKSTTFIPMEPTHSMQLPLLTGPLSRRATLSPGRTTPAPSSRLATPVGSRAASPARTPRGEEGPDQCSIPPIVLLNPTLQQPQRVLSFIKYCLRCAGILYHAWPDFSASLLEPSTPGATSMAMFNSWNSGLARGGSGEVSGLASPTTPLYPPSGASVASERSDGWAHVHILQCVIELPEPEPEESDSGFSLVQSIMAAFGRRPSNKRTMSTPDKPRSTDREPAKAPGTPGHAKATPGASGRQGMIRCLSFYIILRFPKMTTSSGRPAFSRQTSLAPKRQRATSSATSTAAGSESPTVSRGPSLDVDTSALTVRPDTSEEGRTRKPRSRPLSSHSSSHVPTRDSITGESLQLTVETIEQLKRSAGTGQPRSPSSSRAPSRTRKQSRAPRARKAKVLVQVTDERALEAVRSALSVGGTTEGSDEDPLREDDEPVTPQKGDQQSRRKHPHRSTSSLSVASTLRTPNEAFGLQTPRNTSRDRAHRASVGFPFPSREDEQETRGRRGRDNNDASRGSRAPSQLSTVPLKEESPSASDGLRQALVGLSAALDSLVGPSKLPAADKVPESAVSSQEPSPLQSPRQPTSRSSSDTSSSASAKGAAEAYEQARTLLQGLNKHLAHAEREGAPALEDIISPETFTLFSTVSPAMGICDRELEGLPAVPAAVAQEVALSGLATAALQIVARHASPRELFMAAQERLEMLSSLSDPQGSDASMREASESANQENQWGVEVPDFARAKEPHRPCCAAMESCGIIALLAVIVPRIRTKKPLSFIQPLVHLLPRSVSSCLANAPDEDSAADSRISRSACSASIMLAVCHLVKAITDWEAQSAGASQTSGPSGEILEMLFGVFLACAASLPKQVDPDDAERCYAAAELHFRKRHPRFTLSSGASAPEAVTSPGRSATRGATSNDEVWQALRGTTTALHLELQNLAFKREAPSPSAKEDDGMLQRNATMSVGSFMLLVQLRARKLSSIPAWSPDEAERSISDAMPMLHACFGAGPPTSLSSSGTGPPSSGELLADSAQLWLMWCFEALQSKHLQTETVYVLSQSLSTHASLCSRPMSRHVSLRLFYDLLSMHAPIELAMDVLLDSLTDSPFPQLRMACLTLLREMLGEKLGKRKDVKGVQLLERLRRVVFVMPSAPILQQIK
ncbi:hypothetical protein IE81DRAFT_329092 [Ceraceosorus guamensis]|uniref:Protein kinase domain-containing protein n=1 Tax=Ceraceosorus guamensis TaxID=1522189 RepID=A0A316W2B5_9BASI|nr:hypothetical protein IE81DRAFT_329092 [Ceraceosorus guamensis]PWN43892.1 hypothetical protein IE81DRAFT_329092 [Ceraceosorus guamensis]